MTFLNVLVQLVDKGIQLLPLLTRKLKCITGMNPLTQGTEMMENTGMAQSDPNEGSDILNVQRVYLVPMPCPLVPTRANRERKPSAVNHCNTKMHILMHTGMLLVCFVPLMGSNRTHLGFMMFPLTAKRLLWSSVVVGRKLEFIISRSHIRSGGYLSHMGLSRHELFILNYNCWICNDPNDWDIGHTKFNNKFSGFHFI